METPKMDYLSQKLTSISGDAIGGIDELNRRRQEKIELRRRADETRRQNNSSTKITNNNSYGFNLVASRDDRGEHFHSNPNANLNLSEGFPFGGDSTFGSSANRSIGFKADLLASAGISSAAESRPRLDLVPAAPSRSPDAIEDGQVRGEELADDGGGGAWARLWFPRVMLLCLVRLLIFVCKVHEDFQATKHYSKPTGRSGHFMLALATLLLPTLVFTIYRVARYLQIALSASSRALDQAAHNLATNLATYRGGQKSSDAGKQQQVDSNEESQLKRALMGGSPTSQLTTTNLTNDEDGLVTARQSPSQLDGAQPIAPSVETFHDSRSEQPQQVAINSGAEVASSSIVATNVTSMGVNVEPITSESKFQSHLASNSETIQIVIGASEQLLHGALFIFWQLKRQVDVLSYLVGRSCLWRKPSESEKEQLGRLRTGSDGLEWFQDFYAAFLAILAQVYALGLHWAVHNDESQPKLKSSSSLGSSSSQSIVESSNMGSVSSTARMISDTLITKGATLDRDDMLIMSELMVSLAVVGSLLVAVRRRDDGPLTLGLSMLGWGSIFAARIIVIALAFVHLGSLIMVPLIGLHVVAITCWLYKIALDSHNCKASESADERKWLPETGSAGGEDGDQAATDLEEQTSEINVTQGWSLIEHIVLVAQIFTLFAIPSLFYWPIMFNLKLHQRPFKYLALILSENVLLIAAIYFVIAPSASASTLSQWYLLGTVGGFSIMGFLFVSCYIGCKPSLTEYFARADELFNEAERAGIYFEFCSRIFRMPDLSQTAFRRLMNQTERQMADDDQVDDNKEDQIEIELQ